MIYKAENVDTDKALEYIKSAREYQKKEIAIKIAELQGYLRGVEKGLDIAEDIFSCKNYEKNSEF